MSDSVSAIILAGGQSSRMGRPKAELPFGSSTLLDHIVAELGRASGDIVIVAAPSDLAGTQLSIADARIVNDEVAYAGPVGALERGLESVVNETAFACSCDLPFVNGDLARALGAMLGGYDAVIPKAGERLQPLHAVYRKSCGEILATMRAKGVRRLQDIVSFANVRIVPEDEIRQLDPDLLSFFNVNTPDEYQRACELLQQRRRA